MAEGHDGGGEREEDEGDVVDVEAGEEAAEEAEGDAEEAEEEDEEEVKQWCCLLGW